LVRTCLQIGSEKRRTNVLGGHGTVPPSVQELRSAFGESRLYAVPDRGQMFLVEQTQLGLARRKTGHVVALWRRIRRQRRRQRRRRRWYEQRVSHHAHRSTAAAYHRPNFTYGDIDAPNPYTAARRLRRRPRHLLCVRRRLFEVPTIHIT